MRSLAKKIVIPFALLVLAIITHFYVPISSPYRQNQGLKTEARIYSSESCKQSCTISSQGDYNRATATASLLDSTSASIPPGSLIVIVSSVFIANYYYLYIRRQSYRQTQLQQEFCIWRF